MLLVNIAQYFTAYVLLASLGVGHDTLRSREDRDTQTVHFAGHLLNRCILAKTRTAYAVQVLDSVGFGSCIPLESDLDGRVTLLIRVELVRQDVTMLLEDLCNFLLNF